MIDDDRDDLDHDHDLQLAACAANDAMDDVIRYIDTGGPRHGFCDAVDRAVCAWTERHGGSSRTRTAAANLARDLAQQARPWWFDGARDGQIDCDWDPVSSEAAYTEWYHDTPKPWAVEDILTDAAVHALRGFAATAPAAITLTCHYVQMLAFGVIVAQVAALRLPPMPVAAVGHIICRACARVTHPDLSYIPN